MVPTKFEEQKKIDGLLKSYIASTTSYQHVVSSPLIGTPLPPNNFVLIREVSIGKSVL